MDYNTVGKQQFWKGVNVVRRQPLRRASGINGSALVSGSETAADPVLSPGAALVFAPPLAPRGAFRCNESERDVSVFSGPVTKERVYPLIPKGEYVATLLDLTFESGGTYGDSLLWKWMIAERETPTEYIARDDGNEKVLHEYTSPDVTLGSKPHEWIAALTGIVLEDGQQPPDSDELINKRMLVYLTHLAPKKGPNAGKLRERFAEGSSKPFRLPGQKAKPAPTQVSADPEVSDVDRALVVTKLQKQVAKLAKLNAEAGAAAQAGLDASDLDTAPIADLQQLLDQVNEAVNKALDD